MSSGQTGHLAQPPSHSLPGQPGGHPGDPGAPGEPAGRRGGGGGHSCHPGGHPGDLDGRRGGGGGGRPGHPGSRPGDQGDPVGRRAAQVESGGGWREGFFLCVYLHSVHIYILLHICQRIENLTWPSDIGVLISNVMGH